MSAVIAALPISCIGALVPPAPRSVHNVGVINVAGGIGGATQIVDSHDARGRAVVVIVVETGRIGAGLVHLFADGGHASCTLRVC